MASKGYHTFSDHAIEQAAEAVKNGMSYRRAEKKFGVPKSSIQRKVKNVQQNPYGRPTVFNEDEEKTISQCLALTAEWGFPLTVFDVRYVVKKYLDKKGVVESRFKNNFPGSKWAKGFLARQSTELKKRMCTNIKRARAAITPEAIEAYFEELNISLKDVPADAIVNFDETSMQDNPGQTKVIVKRKCKHPERIMDFSKSNFSVMFSGTASGYALPPYVVYKSDNLYNTWMEGGPKGTRFNRSKSGWFEGNIFEDWFESVALPYLKSLGDGPKAIIGDNLASHISANIVKQCTENNIRFILLPPNSTHLCQPLDLAFFSPLKTAWRKLLSEWKMKNRGAVRKDQFPRLLKKGLDAIENNISANLKAGFKKSGIFPINKEEVLKCLPKKSMPNEANDTSSSAVAWSETFEDFLRSTREKETVTKPRKKKFTVTPGKSLCETDIVQVPEDPKENNGQKKRKAAMKKSGKCSKKTKKNVRTYDESSEAESDCNISLHESNSSVGEEDFSTLFNEDVCEQLDMEIELEQRMVYESINENEKVEDCGAASGSTKEGDFVVVKFTYNEGKKTECKKVFIGKVLDVTNSKYKISYLRNYLGSKNTYIYPNVEDIEEDVPLARIERVIKLVSEIRGRFTFE